MTGHLGIEPGAPGSGRARYGRAMALYAEGRITAAQLEAYRVAAADDRQGPGQVLDAHGLAVPEDAAPAGEAAIRTLISAADAYLATLDGPGVTDVRSGIAKWHDGPVTAARPASSPASHPVVATHLPAALAALQGTHPALAAAISGAAPHLTWIAYDGYDPAAIGQAFAQGHAYASIIGEDRSAIPALDFDLGIFLIAPHVLYRDRCHAAPELYAP